jgi:hypothetical protein
MQNLRAYCMALTNEQMRIDFDEFGETEIV